jgi:hypothetical protein
MGDRVGRVLVLIEHMSAVASFLLLGITVDLVSELQSSSDVTVVVVPSIDWV